MLRISRKTGVNLSSSLLRRCARAYHTHYTQRTLIPASNGHEMMFSETKLGHLADSSIICRVGGTVVHAVVVSARADHPTQVMLPLTVDYRAKFHSFGMIPKTGNRREKHNSEEEILVARIIDRVVRPLFPKGYVNDVQITVTVHAADGIHDPAIVGVNAVSYALLKSKQPWSGPIGCTRVGLINGNLVVNPNLQDMADSTLDLVYAGTDSKTLMMEAIGSEVPEATLMEAMEMAQQHVQNIIQQQRLLLPESAHGFKFSGFELTTEQKAALISLGLVESTKLYADVSGDQFKRSQMEGQMRSQLDSKVRSHPLFSGLHPLLLSMSLDYLMTLAFRQAVLQKIEPHNTSTTSSSNNPCNITDPNNLTETSNLPTTNDLLSSSSNNANKTIKRVDGRHSTELRSINSHVDILPVVHGSAFFTRGDTHVIAITTLDSKTKQLVSTPINGLKTETTENFILHYDFPPYSTNELGNSTSINRRMIGHGNLAARALKPLIPSVDVFPYMIRVSSECTSSNGSSSMATVCAASLSLMDAGVPLKAPVAGVSVGLMTSSKQESRLIASVLNSSVVDGAVDGESAVITAGDVVVSGAVCTSTKDNQEIDKFVLLKDIIGSEDHHGDMDFKVAGTTAGITALQLDTKLKGGIPLELLKQALVIAKEGRVEILDNMNKQLASPRSSIKPHAPAAMLIPIDNSRRSVLIGERGEMRKFIEETFECDLEVDMNEDVVYLYGQNLNKVLEARLLIQELAVLVKVGDVLLTEITGIKDFGLKVRLNRGQEALLHMTDFSYDNTLLKKSLNEVVAVGDKLEVKVTRVDSTTGVIKVSRKELLTSATSVPDTFRPIRTSNVSTSIHSSDHDKKDAVNKTIANKVFPTTPPRKYSADFFRRSVVSKEEIRKALDIDSTSNDTNKTSTSAKSGSSENSRRNHASSRSKHRSNKSVAGGEEQEKTENISEIVGDTLSTNDKTKRPKNRGNRPKQPSDKPNEKIITIATAEIIPYASDTASASGDDTIPLAELRDVVQDVVENTAEIK